MDEGRADARTQTAFASVSDQLAPDVTELLSVPPDAQADLALVSMCNFFPLLWPILDALDPKSVCEIGADEGTTTRVLARWCREGSRALTVVDPTIDPGIADDDVVTYVRSTSLNFLAAAPVSDLYLIDGDHNYYTVHGELEAIAEKVPGAATCLLLLHDVSWPCGRRDMYYDPDSIPESARRATADHAVLTMRKSALGEVGMPTDEFRLVEPDPDGKHGIRTAIEDFLAARDGWRFFSIPSVYGLGILWHAGDADAAVTDRVEALAADCERWEPFLATLEFNRLSLLEQRERDGHEWSLAHAAVAELEGEISRTSAAWEEQHRYIRELEARLAGQEETAQDQAGTWQRQQQYIADLQAQVAEREQLLAEQERVTQHVIGDLESRIADQDHAIRRQAQMWADQQRVVDELTTHATKQAGTIAELHRPLGWVRFRYRNR